MSEIARKRLNGARIWAELSLASEETNCRSTSRFHESNTSLIFRLSPDSEAPLPYYVPNAGEVKKCCDAAKKLRTLRPFKAGLAGKNVGDDSTAVRYDMWQT